ncbi:MAG: DUF58 domain-containing protein [Elusimicrobia bacterium]|nr:DUF58 domain-containing protein [Elusimicrobiota bacterium]
MAESLLDPEVLSRLQGLRLLPRFAERNAVTGSNVTSMSRGASTEFVDFKMYTPGDDPRRIDWKIYGRKDRYFLRSYEGETNCTMLIAVDASRSMRFKGPGAVIDKWTWAAKGALGLIYLALANRDACGLALFARGLIGVHSPKASWATLASCVHQMEAFADFGARTDFPKSLSGLAEITRKRSLIIVISDFLGDDPGNMAAAFEALSSAGHEVAALRVLDPIEEDLTRAPAGTLVIEPAEEDNNSAPRLNMAEIAADYRQRWQQEERLFKSRLFERWIDYQVFRTNENIGESIARYLHSRSFRGADIS